MKRLHMVAFISLLGSAEIAGGQTTPTSISAYSEAKAIVKKVERSLKSAPQTKCGRTRINPKMEWACTDLAKLSCTPGEFHDGTGTARDRTAVGKKMIDLNFQYTSALALKLKEAFSSKDPKFEYVRDLARATFKQDQNPLCTSGKQESQIKCSEVTAGMLARYLALEDLPRSEGIHVSFSVDRVEFDYELMSVLTQNAALNKFIEPIRQKYIDAIVQKKTSDRVKKNIFPRVLKLMAAKINQYVQDPEVAKAMIKKLHNITFNDEGCRSPNINSLMTRNARYNSATQTFQICNGMFLESDSEFMIVGSMTHELTHSLDPCNITQSPLMGFKYPESGGLLACEAAYPFKNLIQCLRTRESVGAGRTEWLDDPRFSAHRLSVFNVMNPFCVGDQIGESVSDWMRAEILPEYMDQFHPGLDAEEMLIGYSNVFRSYCGPLRPNHGIEEGFNGLTVDNHPQVPDRINRILLANETVQDQIGCKGVVKKNPARACKPNEPVAGVSVESEWIATASRLRANSKFGDPVNEKQQTLLSEPARVVVPVGPNGEENKR